MNTDEVELVDAEGNARQLTRSRYNYFVKRQEGWIGYNARTGTFVILADDVAELLQSKDAVQDIRDPEHLVQFGFLHYGDELSTVLDVYNTAKDNQILHLTIAPSLACNFSCDYCYQNSYRTDHVMSPEVQAATLDFVQARVAEGRRHVVLEWYGGEPLLAKDLLLAMTPRIRAVVENAGGAIESASIITNGTLLSDQTALELSAVGIKEAQVSFDALTYVDRQKRGLLDQSGRPSLILSNVLAARTSMRVNVRINVSGENKHEIQDIVAVLKSYRLPYYLARVDQFGGEQSQSPQTSVPGLRTDGRRSLPIVDVSANTRQTNGAASAGSGNGASRTTLPRGTYAKLEQGFLTQPEMIQQLVAKLEPKKHFCSATLGAMFVIDADGNISRCWESAGVESQSIGNVLEEQPTGAARSNEAKWTSFNPLAYSACASCRVLPLCMGGCSYPRVVLDSSNAECTSIKQQVQFCVDEVGRRIKVPSRERMP